MIGASKIPNDIRELVMSMYSGFCGVYDCVNRADEVHHRMSNSVANVKKYPLFINSPINLISICRQHHEDGKVLKELKWHDKQARLFEEYLTSVKKG